MKSKAVAMVLALLISALPIVSAGAWEEGNPLVVASSTELSGMFFTGMWGNNISDMDVRAMLHNYSPVVWSDQTSLQLNPTVVKGISVGDYADGNRVYVIEIHDNLQYSDGSPIKAADYVFSLLLQASPLMEELGAKNAGGEHIAGYEAYRAGKRDVFTGIGLVDDYTFMIEVKAEFYPFFYELSYIEVIPYPAAVIAPGCSVADDGKGAYMRGDFTADLLRETILDPETGYQSHPTVTSGPYKLVAFDWDTRVAEFEVNEFFSGTFDEVTPTIERVEFRDYLPEELAPALERGEVDIANRIVTNDEFAAGSALVAAGKAQMVPYPRTGLGYINFACEGDIFRHAAVRKAFSLCLDKEAFCRRISAQAVPIYGYMGIGQWLYTAVAPEAAPAFAVTDEEIEAWNQLSLDGLDKYEKDLDAAERLLIEDGWVLNEHGASYVKGEDDVRYKDVDGELVGLNIRWGRVEGYLASDLLVEMLPDALSEIGMGLIMEKATFQDVLADFYSTSTERRYDMHVLASNISNLFDPSGEYVMDERLGRSLNSTGYVDDRLEALALEMRGVAPGDLLAYAEKWVEFQEYWSEQLPMLPLYSNVYFDFYIPELSNYRPDAEQNWPGAIVRAEIGGLDVELVEEVSDSEEAVLKMF